MMENHPLVLGLKKRLHSSDYKLKDKLMLITNVYQQNVLIPYKDQLIFDWIMATLEEKYSDSNIKETDLEKMWGLLNLCLENINKNGIKMHFDKSDMLTLLDRADMESENAVNSIMQILQVSSKWKEFDSQTSDLCLKLVQKDKCPESLMCLLLKIFSLSERCSPGLFLSSASRHITEASRDAFSEICRDVMLMNTTEGFDHLFSQISKADEKYEGTGEVEIFLDYLKNQGDLPLLLQASNHPSISMKLRTWLFILASYIAGQDLYDKGESLLLAKIDVCFVTAPDLQQIIDKSLPIDLDLEHTMGKSGKTMAVSRILSEALIQVLDTKGINAELLNTIENIFTFHPSILVMLVPLIMSRCFCHQENEFSQTIFKLIVDLMLKMRQFPKVITRFLVYQKTQTEGNEVEHVTWSAPFLQEIENGVFKIPRKQCIEIWNALMFHFNNDCSDLEKDERFWYLTAPLLGAIFTSSLLLDHNVPEPMVVRIKNFLSRTYTEVIIGFQSFQLSSKGQTLYEELVSNFLVFVNLISSYKNLEFPEIKEFEENLIQKIIKKKSLGGYSKLILNCVNTNSVFKDELLKNFSDDLRELTGDVKIISEAVSDADNLEEMDYEENLSFIASTLHKFFVQLNASTGRFVNLVKKDLWTETSDCELQESKLVDFISEELTASYEKPVHFNCNLLKHFPLENLPFVLKLGSTLLALNSFLSPDSTSDSAVILTRCLHQTQIFKHVNPVTFINLILSRPEKIAACLMNQLAQAFSWDSEVIEAVSGRFDEFNEDLLNGVDNSVDFFSLYLEKLANIPNNFQQKAAAAALSHKISKSFMKMCKKDLALESVPYHLKVAVYLLSLKVDLDSKQEKYVRKVVTCSIDTTHFAVLFKRLLDIPERREWLSSDMTFKAWNSLRGSILEKDNLQVGAKILESLDDTEFSNYINQDGNDYNMALILLHMKPTESTKELRKEKLEEILFSLIKAGALSYEEKVNLLVRLSKIQPSPVSTYVEIAVISFLLVPDGTTTMCSPETVSILLNFINHHNIISPRYAGFLVQAIRQHINHLALPTEDIDENFKNVEICTKLGNIFISMSFKTSDWKAVSTYIVSDLVTALVAVTHQELKQLIVANIHKLLSMADKNTFKYLSANMKPAANEIFKMIYDEFQKTKQRNSTT